MIKKIILPIVILCLAAGGFFYWQQSQADVKELNKTLPAGVKVVKSLFGNQYKVVNKIDNYEFKVPPEWQGIKEIEYTPEQKEETRIVRSIYLEGLEGAGRIASIDVYAVNQLDMDLEIWTRELLNEFSLSGELTQETIGNYNVLSMIEKEHLASAYISFLYGDSKVYIFTGRSEEFVHYIITHGKW